MQVEKSQISQTEFNHYVARYIQDLKKEKNGLLEEIKSLREQLDNLTENS